MPFPLDSAVTFGNYRLSARVATGGMAEVYAARRLEPNGAVGPLVAVKRLLPHLARDSAIVRMFLNEARITAQINHPNVVRVLDLGHHEGEPFIAMELLVGRSFADIRERAAERAERVPLGITLKVLTDACRGLDAAHRARDEHGNPMAIVHRDFTPDNIHVGADGKVKVIDFGIAKAQNLGAGTEPGTLKGKFFYMSPEMIAGRPVDHRADLYAAGVMLYEQLCGRRPFTGTTPDEVLQRIAEARPRPPTAFDPSVPSALEEVCLVALRQNPNDRFASLDEFIRAIEAVGGAAEVATAQQLQQYVRRLFPVETDERARAVQQARELDPSMPRAYSDAPIPLTQQVLPGPKPATPPPSRRTPRPPTPAAAQVAPHADSEAASSTSSDDDAPPAKPRGRILAVTAAVVIALAGAGGVWIWSARPSLAPAERLSQAEGSSDPELRRATLAKLGDDDRAGETELARAGQLLLEVKAYDAALELSEAYARRFPASSEARLLEARACIALRQGRRAETAIAAARSLDPKSPEPELVLASLKELQGDATGAAAALGEALRKDPSSTEAARRQGYLLSQAGRLEDADQVLSAALRKKFDAESAAELAFVRYRQDRAAEAVPLLRRALKDSPGLARAHYYLGAVLFRQGDAKGAERAYLEADKLSPEDPQPLIALCEVYAHGRRKAELAALHQRFDERFADRAGALKRQCKAVE